MENGLQFEKVGPMFSNCMVVSWKNHLKLVIVWCLFENSLDIFLLQ